MKRQRSVAEACYQEQWTFLRVIGTCVLTIILDTKRGPWTSFLKRFLGKLE